MLEGSGKVFLSDPAMIRRVPSMAPNPTEVAVSARASCALASVESDARGFGIVVRAASAEVTAIA